MSESIIPYDDSSGQHGMVDTRDSVMEDSDLGPLNFLPPQMFPPRGGMHPMRPPHPRMRMPGHFMPRPGEFGPPFNHGPLERPPFDNQENGMGYDHGHPPPHCDNIPPDFRHRFPYRGPPPPPFYGMPPRFPPAMPPGPPPHMMHMPPPMHHPPPLGPPPPMMHFPPPHVVPPNPQQSQLTPRHRQLNEAMQKGELFVEHQTEDGRHYFYNAKTREAVWVRPEGAGVVFTNQPEFDNLQQVLLLKDHLDKQQPPTQPATSSNSSQNSTEITEPGSLIKPAEVAEWSEHQTPDGRVYFYNSRSMESMWEKPKVMADWEGKVAQFQSQMAAKLETITHEAHNSSNTVSKTAPTVDKTRPVASSNVAGTPWCVVWTGEARVFFYNPSAKVSVWETPEELQSKPDVYRLLTTPPAEVTSLIEPDKLKKYQDEGFQAQLNAVKFIVLPETTKTDDNQSDTSETVGVINNSENEKPSLSDTAVEETDPLTASQNNEASKVDTEKMAAQQRASLPLETRVVQFKEMLAEKSVSAYSTWEKELHKIVFDPRYLLLLSKERKEVFEEYIRESVDEERKAKSVELKKRKEIFKKLLESADLNSKSSFTVFSQKYAKDERFKAIEKMRDREDAFRRFLDELKDKEKKSKDDRSSKRRSDRNEELERSKKPRQSTRTRSRSHSGHRSPDKVKERFMEMLRSCRDITAKTKWNDAKKFLDLRDSRYLDVGSGSSREELFKKYHKELKKERKRKKREKKEAKRIKKEGLSSEQENNGKNGNHSEKKENQDGKMANEESKSAESSQDESSGDEDNVVDSAELEKKRRIAESIRNRQKQVAESLSGALRDREAVVERHKRHEAEDLFRALLSDLIRNSEISWSDAKAQLRHDARYDTAERQLSKDDRKRLFDDHVNKLFCKARETFHKMLDECSDLTLSSSWNDIKPIVESDIRCQRFSTSDRRCKREFEAYMEKRLERTKDDFLSLLKETKLITHKTMSTIREEESNLDELHKLLSNDRRYLDLDCLKRDRDDILMRYLRELEAKGPPPPPTQSDPSARRY